jgi:hypothetical protein
MHEDNSNDWENHFATEVFVSSRDASLEQKSVVVLHNTPRILGLRLQQSLSIHMATNLPQLCICTAGHNPRADL